MAVLMNHPINRDQAKVMNRFRITKRLVELLLADEAVIGGIGYTNFDLWAASAGPGGRRPQNFYMLGSMGLTVPIALGVAIAQPRRRVFALEGDGSMLMQLGSLSTVAARRQQNLCIVITGRIRLPADSRRRRSRGRTSSGSREPQGWRRALGRRMRMRSRSWPSGR
jgi:TPP-dependent 2-oxoacid decarboxylase